MYDLSICLAAIRRHNWERLYNSIVDSIGDYTFELIFCGPFDEGPEELKDKDNIKYIQDFGAPTRAQQLSMLGAQGRYITWAADDGWYLPPGPDNVTLSDLIAHLDADSENPKRCIVTRYNEGVGDGLGDPERGLYCLNTHLNARSQHYPNSFLIFNCAVLTTEYFLELGGFDCEFEVCPMAFCDFGARAQLDGCRPDLVGLSFECTQFPGETGDHAPIHHAQLAKDQPRYSQIWTAAACPDRIRLDINNWKNVPDVWVRRFPDHPKNKE